MRQRQPHRAAVSKRPVAKSFHRQSFAIAIVTLAGLAFASGAEVKPAVPAQAQEFPVSAVRLLDGPFKHAMEVDKAYMLRLDPDRLLSGFRSEAGLPKKAEPYRGGDWEGFQPGERWTMTGHFLGHYLSALCLMAAADGDAECRRRVDYIVDELAACQRASTNGLLAAFPQSRELFAEIAAGNIKGENPNSPPNPRRPQTNTLNRINGGYVPLYSIHKVMAGLRDAWLCFGNETARDVLIRQMDWLDSLVAHLTDDQLQQVLVTEQGGIMESATDVYVIAGNPKYLALARRLNHRAFFDPLVRGEDRLTRVHANASIPKAFGEERVYELTGEKNYGEAARFFWNTVVNERSFVIGGHGSDEFFFGTNEFETIGLTGQGPETCNSYNMLKLSRELWLVEPSSAKADFIERTLFNHILASQDPDNGGFSYFTPMGPGAVRGYDRNGFPCCNGTGMENHGKYGEYIYAHAGNRLWVDLLIPSELTWSEQGATVKLETHFPADGKATLSFTLKEPRKLAISIRNPGWLAPGAMKLAVNGVAEKAGAATESYAVVERTWKTGDQLEVDWPMALRTEWLPHSTKYIAVLWGPIVLAGELGSLNAGNTGAAPRRGNRPPRGMLAGSVPVFEGTPGDLLTKIKPVDDSHQTFQTEGLAKPVEVTLAPFYTVHNQPYAVYWRLVKPTADQPGP
jgi:uncharacterized protein